MASWTKIKDDYKKKHLTYQNYKIFGEPYDKKFTIILKNSKTGKKYGVLQIFLVHIF